MKKRNLNLLRMSAVGFFVLSLLAGLFPQNAQAEEKVYTWWSCEPNEIIELPNRIHVKCEFPINVGDVVYYLAITKSKPEETARFISLA